MKTLYTIGHSTRTFSEFLGLLKHFDIKEIVDVRSYPYSRRMPWFCKDQLKLALRQNKIRYQLMTGLGGRRKTIKDSINLGWRSLSFRGYADYMQTNEFFENLKKLNAYLKETKDNIAIMCAEALPWKCHRSLISDAQVARGIKVLHIMNPSTLKPHELTAFAVIERNKRPIKIIYPDKKIKNTKQQNLF